MGFFDPLIAAIDNFFGGDVPPRMEPTVTTNKANPPEFKEPFDYAKGGVTYNPGPKTEKVLNADQAEGLMKTVEATQKVYNAPQDWWNDLMSTRPGPARIRVTLNRDLTPAEQETIRQTASLVRQTLGDKIRVTPDSRIFVESREATSRELFEALASVVAESFVNVHPVAVRTFRELV